MYSIVLVHLDSLAVSVVGPFKTRELAAKFGKEQYGPEVTKKYRVRIAKTYSQKEIVEGKAAKVS